MSRGKSDEQGNLTVEDMRVWHREEIRNVLKECDLRVRDATEFTTAYSAGKLTPEEANERLDRYEDRWGDALGGVFASGHKSDESIVNAIDRHTKELRKQEEAAGYARRFGNHPLSGRSGR